MTTGPARGPERVETVASFDHCCICLFIRAPSKLISGGPKSPSPRSPVSTCQIESSQSFLVVTAGNDPATCGL